MVDSQAFLFAQFAVEMCHNSTVKIHYCNIRLDRLIFTKEQYKILGCSREKSFADLKDLLSTV